MYHEQSFCFDPARVQRLLNLTRQLDITAGPGGSRFSPWAPTRQLLGPELGMFPNLIQVAVVALYPSSQIVAHRDAPIVGIRYHIPLQTNEGCWSFSNGVWQQLEVGSVYQMDPTEVHGAVNWGDTIRLHLLVDVQ